MVIFAIARKPCKARSIEPFKVFREPLLQTRQIRRGESFGVRKEWNALHNLCKMHSLDETFRPAGLCGWNGLAVKKAWVHTGRRIQEPGPQMRYGLLVHSATRR